MFSSQAMNLYHLILSASPSLGQSGDGALVLAIGDNEPVSPNKSVAHKAIAFSQDVPELSDGNVHWAML